MDQHENLPPRGFSQSTPVPTHGDEIPSSIATVELGESSFPSIIRAMNFIREDNGGAAWSPEANPRVAARWRPFLEEIEGAIGTLEDDAPAPEDTATLELVAKNGFSYCDSALYCFCNGEASSMEAIRSRSSGLSLASKFLNDFFESWMLYNDLGFDPAPPGPN